MISADGRTIAIGDIVFIQCGGEVNEVQRCSQMRVSKLGRTRVRLERLHGKTGSFRKPEEIWFTKEAARIGFQWKKLNF